MGEQQARELIMGLQKKGPGLALNYTSFGHGGEAPYYMPITKPNSPNYALPPKAFAFPSDHEEEDSDSILSCLS